MIIGEVLVIFEGAMATQRGCDATRKEEAQRTILSLVDDEWRIQGVCELAFFLMYNEMHWCTKVQLRRSILC